MPSRKFDATPSRYLGKFGKEQTVIKWVYVLIFQGNQFEIKHEESFDGDEFSFLHPTGSVHQWMNKIEVKEETEKFGHFVSINDVKQEKSD